MHEVITQWEAGQLSDLEALKLLLADYGAASAEIAPYTSQIDAIKAAVKAIADRLNAPQRGVAGYDVLRVEGKHETVADTAAIKDLIAVYAGLGDATLPASAVASALAACLVPKTRAGYWTIAPVKARS